MMRTPRDFRTHPLILAIGLAAAAASGCGGGSGGSGGASTTSNGGTTDGGATDGGPGDAAGTDTGSSTDAESSSDTGASADAASPSADTGTTSADAGRAPESQHNSFDTALPLKVGAAAVDEQLAPTGELDYFSFEGKKGDAIYIGITAQTTPFDKASIDTVLTLYDDGHDKIAENDDPMPRTTNDSGLFTILPKDGTYYIVVQECSTWIAAKGLTEGCAEPKDKTEDSYSILVGKLDGSKSWVVPDEEKGDTAADATQIGYSKSGSAYAYSRVYGTFKDGKDIDYFKFLMPADIDAEGTRLMASFEVFPWGTEGNGSTSSPGTISISLAKAPTEILARVDASQPGAGLALPVEGGEEYLLQVVHPAGSAGPNDFYFFNHRPSGDNPLETKDQANNDLKTPEPMVAGKTLSGSDGYFIAGDLVPADKDVDHFSIAVPSGKETQKFSIFCRARRAGSGLRGFTVSVLKENGTPFSGAVKFEDAKTSPGIENMPIGGASKLIIKLNADKQDPAVKSSFYRCGAVIHP